MSSFGWLCACFGCLLAALLPIGIADSLVANGVSVLLLTVAVPFVLLLTGSGYCCKRMLKAIDDEWR
jgi:hypothetical protein